jgi:glutamate-1-semialdehyde 2,1-aminomutase
MTHDVSASWKAYRESTQHLAQGSSTSSKAPVLEDAEPAQILRGCGCRVWDVDGNEYIDYRNALGPVTLGYAVPEINAAIMVQLEDGIIFGHPHPLEGAVAAMLTERIPCAERVRFLKTGGEAIAACIKIARHATGKNRILHCGYNGWLNSLSAGGYRPQGIAASEPAKGVPPAISDLHHAMPWAETAAWEETLEKDADIAAVVIACAYADMDAGKTFLPAIRRLTENRGVLMIMDEIVTGFRLARGGAQEFFEFTPDLAVFGKGLANGMPLSVYAGRADLIDSARDLGISSTFGGETLSLAAAREVLRHYDEHHVVAHLWERGTELWGRLNILFAAKGVPAEAAGYPVCPQFSGENAFLQAFFRECYREGVSLYNVSYVTAAHGPADIQQTLERMERALGRTLGNGP